MESDVDRYRDIQFLHWLLRRWWRNLGDVRIAAVNFLQVVDQCVVRPAKLRSVIIQVLSVDRMHKLVGIRDLSRNECCCGHGWWVLGCEVLAADHNAAVAAGCDRSHDLEAGIGVIALEVAVGVDSSCAGRRG